MTNWKAEYEAMEALTARAICEAHGYDPDKPYSRGALNWHMWMRESRAALAAIGITPERQVLIMELSPELTAAISRLKLFNDEMRLAAEPHAEKEQDDG